MRVDLVCEGDAAELLAIYRPYVEKTAVTFEYQVPSEAEFAGRIKKTLERYPYLAAWEGKEILGYAYAGPFHSRAAYAWSAETSVYVREDWRGRGVGKRLYQALEQVLKEQNIRNLYACIAFPDREDPYLTRDSVDFHLHMGYRMAGKFENCGCKFGRWYSMVWMEKMLGPHPEKPEPVKTLQEAVSAAKGNRKGTENRGCGGKIWGIS